MPVVTLTKDLAVSEDLETGMGTVGQDRGTGTQINGSNIPYSSTESINEAIDFKESTIDLDAKLALKADLAGNGLQQFSVAGATLSNHATSLSQVQSALALKEDITDNDAKLLLKADTDNVLLKDGNSPAFTPTLDNQPCTKKYADALVIDSGTGDMAKVVYDTNDSGVVDSSEAIGLAATFLGITNNTQIMRLSQSNVIDADTLDDMGVYVGTDVANTPSLGTIVLEQFQTLGLKAQRHYNFTTSKWYYRKFTGAVWTVWEIVVDETKLAADLALKYSLVAATTGNLVEFGTDGNTLVDTGVAAVDIAAFPPQAGKSAMELQTDGAAVAWSPIRSNPTNLSANETLIGNGSMVSPTIDDTFTVTVPDGQVLVIL